MKAAITRGPKQCRELSEGARMISFALTEQQEIACSVVADFALSVLAPAARAADEANELPTSIMSPVWDLGLVQAAADREAGSSEQPTVQNALLLEELARGDATAALAIAAPLGFVKAIAEQGSERQRHDLLPLFLRNQPNYSAIGHVDSGWFNGAGRSMKALKSENGYRLSGAKALVPMAAQCSHVLVLAKCDGTDEAFIVPTHEAGVKISAPRETLGLRASAMADIAMENVFVPANLRLGENAGANVQRIIDSSRVALSAILTGLSRAVFDTALPYTKERVVHGEAIARKQGIAFKLADMHIALGSMRWMGLKAAAELDAGPTALRSARLAQLFATDAAMRIADEGLQVFGGHGFTRDLPLEMWYRNARSLSVLDGLIGA
jgi:alkylation response protein AidB-like acyl-CoA dehydrogenase